MELLRVRERGQITISKTLREQLGVGENSTLLAYVQNGRLILEPVPQPRGDLLSIIGLLPSRGEVDAKEARREAQRRRAQRWTERHGEVNEGEVNELARSVARALEARRVKGAATVLKVSLKRAKQQAAAAEDPAGVER
ncbi:MAG TPA: AbrB/MazE/SpoVT family DNA-binding domain-containing protein [Thermaerobacter sp.]